MKSAVSPIEPSSDRRDTETAYRPDIDGLRAIAVTSVVLFHAIVWPFSSGFVGVDIFFVISGYLIGGIILRGATGGRFSFAQFYARRVRRILPALVFVIIATLLFGSVSLGAAEFGTLAKTSASAILGVSNIQFWRDVSYFAPDAKLNPLLMTWSLGVEEQFYLFFPWLILLFVHRSRTFVIGSLVAATVASFVLSLWATTHYPQASFYLLPARAWELGVGAAIAAVQQLGGSRRRLGDAGREAVGWLGLAATLGSLVLFDEHTPFPGWAAVLPIFGAAALICAQGSFVNRRLLSAKPVVFIGKISYSWYLWHWPLMTYMRVSSAVPLPKWSLAAGGLVALGLAYLSWRYIEQPFRKRQLPNHTVLIRYAGAVAVLLAACLGIGLGRGLPNRLPPTALETERVVARVHADPCLAGWGDATPDESSKCVQVGDHRPAIAVIGDSHAAALGPGVQRLARGAGWGSMVLTKSSCRPLLGVTVWRRIEPAFEADCAAFMTAAYEMVRRDPEVKIVVLAGAWSGPFEAKWGEYYVSSARDPHDVSAASVLLRQGLENAVRSLAASGKEVVVMGDTPLWKFDPAKVALTSSLPVRLALATGLQGHLDRFGYDRSAGVEPRNAQVDDIMRSIGQMDRTKYIDLFPRFCDAKRCLFHSESDLLFVDASHLSPAGATLALGTLDLAPAMSRDVQRP